MSTNNEEDEPPPPTPFPLPPLSCALSPGLPRRIRPPPEVSSYAGAGATTTVSSNGDDVDAQLLAARPPRHPSCASLPSAARVSRCLCPRCLIATLTSLLSTAPTRSSAAAADPHADLVLGGGSWRAPSPRRRRRLTWTGSFTPTSAALAVVGERIYTRRRSQRSRYS